MNNGNQKRTRSERVATLALPPGALGRMLGYLQSRHVLVRLALCALAAVFLWAITSAWAPPFPFREGDIPPRDVTARVQFEQVDALRTQQEREEARQFALVVYRQDPAPLEQLRAELMLAINRIVQAEQLSDLEPGVWEAFQGPQPQGEPEVPADTRAVWFETFRTAMAGDGAEKTMKVVAEVLAPYEQRGLLERLPDDHTGNLDKIFVETPKNRSGYPTEVAVSAVMISNAESAIKAALSQNFDSPEVAQRVHAYLQPRLPSTLKLDRGATRIEQEKAAMAVPEQTTVYAKGQMLAPAGEPLAGDALQLLWLEYQNVVADRSLLAKAARSLAALGMYVALYTLCGFYIYFREPRMIAKLSRLFAMLSMVVLSVAVCMLVARDAWRAELVPLLLFAMTVSIAYHHELALLLSAAVTLIITMALGHDLGDAVILMAANVGAVLSVGRIRTRLKLLFVGMCAGAVALLTTIGVGVLEGGQMYPSLVQDSLRFGLWGVIAGALMTCLLPFIERMFGVQTDLSLRELGDPAHPLLQELVRRAPGTYNHSITVASLAESAAEAIGARGLLVRVGAYFHDIGKMLKPGYFIENQSRGDNRHESLVPAMSTLVIIAHVKDGADLARKSHLPEPIIDFIQQHHGTTLVEYFYRRANEQKELDPDGSEVDESSFRYPGPKPQTKEAGVLMLADAVESASRVLVEPTPSRIENLVHELTQKRLTDGQFDECGMTLQEVHVIRESLIKSLTAVYHGRVKYPDQQTA
ncbi:MAG: HDIG domain-containing metalloprotein [Pirellulales bacterium]